MLRFISQHLFCWLMVAYFNTSHVKVYPVAGCIGSAEQDYFNTSHVKVYHGTVEFPEESKKYFNTSHVKVYHQTDRADSQM